MKKVIFPILILFLLITSAYAQEVGKITALQGKVDLLREGKPPAIEAKINLSVYLKDIIRTKTDSKAEITFKDGTVLRIAPRSRVDISEYLSDSDTVKATINLPRGKVAAYVSETAVKKIKDSPSANKFEIKTPIAVAGVRGTNYLVAHYPTYSTVLVLTGQVYCYNVHFPENVVILNAGQMTVIKEKMMPAPPTSLTPPQIQREERDVIIGTGVIPSPKTELPVAFAEVPAPAYFATPKENQVPVSNLTTVESPLTNVIKPITENPQIAEKLTPPPPPPPPPPPSGGGGGGGSSPAPNINIFFVSATPGSVYLKYHVYADQPVIVQYRTLESGYSWTSWTDANSTYESDLYVKVPVSVTTSPGYFQIQLRARNSDGVYSTKYTDPSSDYLAIYYNSVTGKVSNLTTDITGDGGVATVLGREGTGVVKINLSTPLPFYSTLEGSGGDSNYGWWVLSASNWESNQGKFLHSTFRLLTKDYYYKSSTEGFVPILDASNNITALTSVPTIDLIPISFYSSIGSTPKIYENNFSELTGTSFSGYLGGQGYASNDGLYFVGQITGTGVDFSTGQGYVWYTGISSPFNGYMAGRFGPDSDIMYYNSKAYLAGILPSIDGLFVGELSVGGDANVLQHLKSFFMEGDVTGSVTLGSSSPSNGLISDLYCLDSNFIVNNNLNYSTNDLYLDTTKYGVGVIGMGGGISSIPSPTWYIEYTGGFGPNGEFGAIAQGDVFGEEAGIQNVISGKTYGYYADLTPVTPVTGIFVGETVGTFNPSNTNWQTVTVGTFIETNTYLSNLDKLGDIKIPVVEVGRANFSGTGNNLTINMDNVVFFSTQSGQRPLLWATSTVSGTYSGTPELNSSITLTGSAGSVNFTPTYWLSNKWAATIDTASPINLSGGSYNGQVNMKGAGTGTYTETQTRQGTLSGTAAGYCK